MISGLLVSSFPIVLGCDASGVVVEVGKEAESFFKVGDRVCGCTRLGDPGYGTFQEYVRIIDCPFFFFFASPFSFSKNAVEYHH